MEVKQHGTEISVLNIEVTWSVFHCNITVYYSMYLVLYIDMCPCLVIICRANGHRAANPLMAISQICTGPYVQDHQKYRISSSF